MRKKDAQTALRMREYVLSYSEFRKWAKGKDKELVLKMASTIAMDDDLYFSLHGGTLEIDRIEPSEALHEELEILKMRLG